MADPDERASPPASTSDRILDASMALFAAHGYRETTIADIETAAGVTPRAGTFYNHFVSKEQLLYACVERHVKDLEQMQDAIEMLPLGDLHAELLLIGRWNLADLARRQSVYRFLWREGERFPELRDRVRKAFLERPLRRVADWLAQRAQQCGVKDLDCDALALVMVQSMAAYRSLEELYGSAPLGVSEERFLDAWVQASFGAAQQVGIDLAEGAPL